MLPRKQIIGIFKHFVSAAYHNFLPTGEIAKIDINNQYEIFNIIETNVICKSTRKNTKEQRRSTFIQNKHYKISESTSQISWWNLKLKVTNQLDIYLKSKQMK